MSSEDYFMPDKEAAIMVLTFQFDTGTDKAKVFSDACDINDLELNATVGCIGMGKLTQLRLLLNIIKFQEAIF